jgi:uncharacterized protein YciI
MNEKKSNAIAENAPEHTTYWHNQNLPDYKGGPFSDFSGGLISFRAENQSKADNLVSEDPFVMKELLSNMWIKEWKI